MLVAFDIGNTKISVGCFVGKLLKFDIELGTDLGRTLDEYTALLVTLFRHKMPKSEKVTESIISSVVPPLTQNICDFVRSFFDVEPKLVGPGLKTGISISTREPTGVGADRVVNAVAAKTYYSTPALVVDFSTAISIDYITESGAYGGSIITPGLRVSLDALVEHTAQLPRIDIAWPGAVIGRSTREAMQSGATIGYLSMVDALVERAAEEIGSMPDVIATGEFAELYVQHSKYCEKVDPHLTLKGLQVISELNS